MTGHLLRNRIDLTAGVDLDDLLLPAVYACEAPTNGPADADFMVEVYIAVDTPTRYVIQRATNIADGTTYVRVYDGAVWSGSWSSIGSGGGAGIEVVRAATTGAITIATGLNDGDSIDGVTLATDDIVLVKNQADQTTNGLYIVGPSPVKADGFTDYDNYLGLMVLVQTGTVNGNKLFVSTSDPGGSNIVFIDPVLAYAVDKAGDTLTGGFVQTSFAATLTGTYVPDALDGNFQHGTNNAAFQLDPPATVCSIILEVTNGASAGAITTSEFDYVSGDDLTTTNTEKFLLYITKSQTYSHLAIQRLQ